MTGSSRFMDALDGGSWQYGDSSYPEAGVTFFAGTFFRHPLALNTVLAVLQHLKANGPGLQQALSERTTHLVGELKGLFESRLVPARIEHFSSFFYFSFPPEQRFGSLIYYHLREKGIHIQEGYPCFLSTAHTEEDLARVTKAFRESIIEMEEGGVLSGPAGVKSSSTPVTPRVVGLTPSQMEILLSVQLGDDASCAFNESLNLHLRGHLDRGVLTTAIKNLVDRHDALRGTFETKRGYQRIHDHVGVDVPLIDLSTTPEPERGASLNRLIDEDAALPFDLESGPLVRFKLVCLDSKRHTLVFTAHHIVCDGWSMNILLEELGKFYVAVRRNGDVGLPVPAKFIDFVARQAEWAKSPNHAIVEDYWVRQFTLPLPPLELPGDRPRGAVKSFLGGTVRKTIDKNTYQNIRRFGAQQGCTMFATSLAGFEILIHRLCNQTEFAVGIPAAGQAKLEGEPLVGHCINFLPLRCTFEDATTVGQALAQAKRQLLDAYDNQDYTYGTLVRKLDIPRDPSRLPLVAVQINLERLGTRFEIPGLEANAVPNPKRFVNFDLFLNVVESENGLVLDCDFNRDLFDETTISRWLNHYATLLQEIVKGSDSAVASLPILDEFERHRLVSEWNATQQAFPRDKCAHHLIEEQVTRTPQDVAVIAESRHLTYAELDAKANRLANCLRRKGVGPGTVVAIFMNRSSEMIVAALSIWKAGGCYIPMDPAYPAEWVKAILDDARPQVVVTQKNVASELPPNVAVQVLIDDDHVDIGPPIEFETVRSLTPENLAYIIYTSGSTGRPKGVEVPHRCVVNFLTSMAREPGLKADDTVVAVTTFSFDIAVLELFLPLTVGARVVLASREVAADGHALRDLISRSKATLLQATPVTWRFLLEAGWSGGNDLKALCGGEAMTRDLADALLPHCSSLWNMYGPTETTVWSSVLRIEPGNGPVPIGPPIANTSFYVLNRLLQPTPVGVPGELYIGGEGVGRGYTNLAQLTVEKFVLNPFDGDRNARFYRTGDLVRYRPNGTIEFLGRLDNQVKVRGFRIETNEVESVLKLYPGIRECVVDAVEVLSVGRQLVAYLVADGPQAQTRDMRKFIASKLPDYMVPSRFISVSSIPRTPNGKVNRQALSLVAETPSNAKEESYTAPRDPREKVLADICAAVLNLECISVTASLFDLGADSLQMFQIVARAFDAGMNLSLKQILARRTVASICADLDCPDLKRAISTAPPLVSGAREQYRILRTLLSHSDAPISEIINDV